MNWDALGMLPTKTPHSLFAVNVAAYQGAVDWVRAELARQGYLVTTAVLDPPLEVWRFYDGEKSLVATVPHALMERVLGALIWRERDVA